MRINTNELTHILGGEITRRSTIDDSKDGRIIEKVSLVEEGEVLLKYGNDHGIRRELLVYDLFARCGEQSVPKPLVHKKIKDSCFLAIQWIEGTHPDFSQEHEITLIFSSLGQWAARWNHRVEQLAALDHEFWEKQTGRFATLKKLLDEHESLIFDAGGEVLVSLLKKATAYEEFALSRICKMPLTLDPGDISLHNMLVAQDRTAVSFIDFESAKVRPMVMLFEHFAEGYESIPFTEDGIQLALSTFYETWNRESKQIILWEDFYAGCCCAMLNYKISDFLYWFRLIMEDGRTDQVTEWIQEGTERLQQWFIKFDAYICGGNQTNLLGSASDPDADDLTHGII